MIRAIDEYEITGIKTTLSFCKFVFQHPAFIDGSFDTKFVERFFTPENINVPQENEEVIAAMMAIHALEADRSESSTKNASAIASNGEAGWRKRLK
jgi:acetyl/propionyl-CoA carboxylase alpha subunit